MDLYSEIIKQNANALSKAITLAESNLESDQIVSQNLISKFKKNMKHNLIWRMVPDNKCDNKGNIFCSSLISIQTLWEKILEL